MRLTYYKGLFICFLLIILTTGCSTKSNKTQEISLEDYALNDAFETCKSAASEMTDGAKGSSNQRWESYFEMCMSSKGYEQKQYDHFWY